MKQLLICILLFLPDYARSVVQGVPDQDDSAKKVVLVVPYSRFEFYTVIALSEIASINAIESSEVYNQYKETLLDALVTTDCESLHFKIINDMDLEYLKRRVTLEMSKKPKYYSANLENLDQVDLENILSSNGATLILFVNWYHIKKDTQANAAEGLKSTAFSRHFIDFDVYNQEKNLVYWSAQYTFKQEINFSNVEYQGLKLSSLRPAYQDLARSLCEKLSSR